MSAVRSYAVRVSRLQLSGRYQYLHRHASTTTSSGPAVITTPIPSTVTAPPIAEPTSLPQSPPPPPTSPPAAPPSSFRSFFRENWLLITCGAVAINLGVLAATQVIAVLAPPPPPAPGTPEDNQHLAELNTRIDVDFKVNVLRGKCLGVARQLKGEEAGWVEVVPAAPATASGPVAGGPLIQHLQGGLGLGVERIFYNRGERQLVAVVWFGSVLSGWPGVTHGGILATALTEKISLAAALANPDSRETAAAVPQRMPTTGDHAKVTMPMALGPAPTELALSYVKPTRANNFYVLRVNEVEFDETRETPHMREPFTTGHGYEAVIETMGGSVCVKAQAKIASHALSTLEEGQHTVLEGAEKRYAEFKQWLWPSRQQQSSLV